MEWKLSELSVDGKGHYGIGAPAIPYDKNKPTYLRITDINDDGTINFLDLKSVDDEDSNKYLLKENDIVFARTGNSTGRSYFYQKEHGDFVYAGFLIKFSIDPQKVNPKILKYYTHSQEYYNWVKSFDTGGTRGNINAKTFGDMPISLPKRCVQDKIVGILSALDSKIENNNKINGNLEAQAQALFKSWFVDFTPFKDQPFVDSELGPIPQGWKVEKINDLDLYITDFVSNGSFASLKQNVTLYSDENYAFFIRNTDLKEGRFRAYVDKSSYFFLKKSVLHGGEIIISNVGDVGSVNLCPKLNKPMTLGNNIIMLKSEDEATHNFLYILFKWSYGKSLIKSITGGSAQPKFNKGDFKSLKIIMPTGKKLSDFNLIASSLLKKIEEFKKENQRLAALRDTLLPKLMSGEIKL